MENNCSGICDNHTHSSKDLSRKAVLGGLATLLTGIGLTSLGESAEAAAKTYNICKKTAVPVGSAKVFTVNGVSLLITQPRAGVFRAFKNQCTHKTQALGAQTLNGGNIVCPKHSAQFSGDTGAVSGFGPASKSLTKYTAGTSGTYVTVKI